MEWNNILTLFLLVVICEYSVPVVFTTASSYSPLLATLFPFSVYGQGHISHGHGHGQISYGHGAGGYGGGSGPSNRHSSPFLLFRKKFPHKVWKPSGPPDKTPWQPVSTTEPPPPPPPEYWKEKKKKHVIYVLLKEPKVHTQVQVQPTEESPPPEVVLQYEPQKGSLQTHFDLERPKTATIPQLPPPPPPAPIIPLIASTTQEPTPGYVFSGYSQVNLNTADPGFLSNLYKRTPFIAMPEHFVQEGQESIIKPREEVRVSQSVSVVTKSVNSA